VPGGNVLRRPDERFRDEASPAKAAQTVTAPWRTSTAGVDFICRWEGFVDHEYKDRAGLDTIGFGHRVRPGETFPATITRDEGETLMGADLAWCEAGVNRDVLVPIPSQCCFDALVSFVYNAGEGALEHSSALAEINAGDFTAGARLLQKWDKRLDPKRGNLVVDAGLDARRAAEIKLFLSDGAAAAEDNPYG
jgi:lysozyme